MPSLRNYGTVGKKLWIIIYNDTEKHTNCQKREKESKGIE